jgi:hypothetical protein
LLHPRKAIEDPDSSIEVPGVLRQDFPQGTGDVFILGVATGLRFRVDETIVEHDLEPPAARGDQDESVNGSLELVEQLIGRAHGTVPIASNGAIFNAEIHGSNRSRPCERSRALVPEDVRDPELAAGGELVVVVVGAGTVVVTAGIVVVVVGASVVDVVVGVVVDTIVVETPADVVVVVEDAMRDAATTSGTDLGGVLPESPNAGTTRTAERTATNASRMRDNDRGFMRALVRG